jgi:hypothetical protein
MFWGLKLSWPHPSNPCLAPGNSSVACPLQLHTLSPSHFCPAWFRMGKSSVGGCGDSLYVTHSFLFQFYAPPPSRTGQHCRAQIPTTPKGLHCLFLHQLRSPLLRVSTLSENLVRLKAAICSSSRPYSWQHRMFTGYRGRSGGWKEVFQVPKG